MMRAFLLCAVIATVSGASIDTIKTPNNTASNVTKREVLEFYPDWVPFKNKRGDELGEFVDVTKPKAKVKKRLALPMNFLMRSVSDDSDDYLGQGETDSDDYYDKKDWSDVHRPVYNKTSPDHVQANASDIDGVLNIITQETPSLADDINRSIQKPADYDQEQPKENIKVIRTPAEHSTTTAEPPELENPKHIEQPAEDEEAPKLKVNIFSDYEDEAVSSTTKRPEITEEERQENEEKKRIILDSVDQLKQRHEAEQREISDKTEDEAFDNEFRHKNIQFKKNRSRFDKRRGKPTPPNYDEYEDLSWKDKYSINVEKKTEPPIISSTATTIEPTQVRRRIRSTTERMVKAEPPKYSVFRNPNLYIIDDEDLNDKKDHRSTKPPRRFSAKYSSAQANAIDGLDKNAPPVSETAVAETVEPILYFPKVKSRRKQKKTRRMSTTTNAPDSSVAETVEDKLKHTTIPVTYPDTTAPATAEDYKTTAVDSDYPTSTDSLWKDDKPAKNKETTAQDTEGTTYHETTAPAEDLKTTAAEFTSPSGYSAEAESSNTDAVTDAVPAPSHHAKGETKAEPKDYNVEKGGGSEHHSSHEEEHEEHGKKAYELTSTTVDAPTTTTASSSTTPAREKYSMYMISCGKIKPNRIVPWYHHYKLDGLHKNTKNKKGHHDKEDHLGKYEDRGGHDKNHHNEGEHYGAHHHEEHGKKHAKYEESGKHSKGHSTKGSHDIHKKEEYEKNVEFFEEEGDSAEEEKHGGFHDEKEHKSGGLFKRGNLNAAHDEKKKGESGHFVKGGHHDVNKGHKSSVGHDSHGKHGSAQHKAGGHHGGKKWVYHHGFPPKNANLIVIDRRTDRYMHGPNYYG